MDDATMAATMTAAVAAESAETAAEWQMHGMNRRVQTMMMTTTMTERTTMILMMIRRETTVAVKMTMSHWSDCHHSDSVAPSSPTRAFGVARPIRSNQSLRVLWSDEVNQSD
jgi:hypothetical protein